MISDPSSTSGLKGSTILAIGRRRNTKRCIYASVAHNAFLGFGIDTVVKAVGLFKPKKAKSSVASSKAELDSPRASGLQFHNLH